ncbi:litaf-like zinc finger domain-containing protein [Colletotrichum incanum]|uniref:Litaf-like zinc finger domain-containing protein n=1 Tax=Colletotrichum incanum TaxID=1573173 RepID=A0A167E608_COLIC|nr:litaf-like zinc finger domain-containing protein [Colletotrichum incanum]OHW98956.1 litaf-like zinc finger domain-containing protein [Colletotrichum incanum]
MDKPAQQHPVEAPGSDNYVSSGPPPEYQHQQDPLNHQQTGTTAAAMPKYGGPTNTPPPHGYGGYNPPLQPQQSFPMQGGPQNFQPYGTPLPALGPHPAPVECPDCHARGVTAVEYSSGGFTHALAAIVCFVSCLGCIPYFFTSLKDARHKCSKCGIPLATYHRSGRTEVHWHQAYNG